MDHMMTAVAADAHIRAFAADTKELVERGRKIHNTTPVVTAAFGRTLTAAVIMGLMMKGDKDILTVIIDGDGPVGRITVTADSKGHVKGYMKTADVILPLKQNGKLDVGRAVGKGSLTVIKDLGLKDPYVGQTELVNGEIAEDFTYYFAASEQTPSSVGLGVLVERNRTVRQAGGFIVQLMPDTPEEAISRLEENIKKIDPVTVMLDNGLSTEDMLRRLLDGLDPEITGTVPLSYECNCSRDRMAKALISIGEKELQSLIDEGIPAELSCNFCGSRYTFEVEDLEAMLEAAKRPAK